MLLIRHYKKEQIYDILRSIFHFINCNSFIVIFTICVCVDHCLFIQVWSIFYMDSLHASPFCDFISKVVLLYCIYIIHYSFFSSKFLYQLLLPVTMMLETWYVTYGWGQDNILYLYSHNHIRCFAISRENITMFIKSFLVLVKVSNIYRWLTIYMFILP